MLILNIFQEVPTAIIVEGIVVSIVGYTIVFAALVLLFYFFNLLSKLINKNIKFKLLKQGKLHPADTGKDISVPGEVTAAIGMALYLSMDIHDEESNVITIKKVSRIYSPWSSKIYGLRNFHR